MTYLLIELEQLESSHMTSETKFESDLCQQK